MAAVFGAMGPLTKLEELDFKATGRGKGAATALAGQIKNWPELRKLGLLRGGAPKVVLDELKRLDRQIRPDGTVSLLREISGRLVANEAAVRPRLAHTAQGEMEAAGSEPDEVEEAGSELGEVEEGASEQIEIEEAGSEPGSGEEPEDELDMFDQDTLKACFAVCHSGSKNLILAGPPGTSKTFLAQLLADKYTRKDRARQEFVQFHPSYTYERFVEGLTPVEAVGSQIVFKPRDGPLKRAANMAKEDSQKTCVLILDELNRCHVPKVFGELLYLMEYRGEEIELQHSRFHGEQPVKFSIPGNLIIIATLNVADRSINSLDSAFGRRFDQVNLKPNPGLLNRFYRDKMRPPLPQEDRKIIVEGFIQLNQMVKDTLDHDRKVGHALLMPRQVNAEFGKAQLRHAWATKIYPRLCEWLPGKFNEGKLKYFGIHMFWSEWFTADDDEKIRGDEKEEWKSDSESDS
jgi:hypothetical protein